MAAMNFLRFVLIAGCSVAVLWGGTARAQNAASGQSGQPPGQEAAGFDAQRLFATSCGWCHQGGGRVQGRGPKLAGTDKSDEYIVNQIKNGKPPGMPAFGRSFNEDQIRAIVAYIRGLKDTP